MRSEHPIIVPNEGLGVAVVWHGGVTFNVHVLHDASLVGMTAVVGEEVDVFTSYGYHFERPTISEAYSEILEWFDGKEQKMREEDDDA